MNCSCHPQDTANIIDRRDEFKVRLRQIALRDKNNSLKDWLSSVANRPATEIMKIKSGKRRKKSAAGKIPLEQ
jgi:hypothetical protein